MTEPNTEVKKLFNLDQAVSVNSFLDIQIDGVTEKLQVTTRAGATAEQITKVVNAHLDAVSQIRKAHPAPANNPESTRVEVGDDGNPLPEVKKTVAEKMEIGLWKDKLSVHVMGKPWTKYGIPLYEETWVAAGLEIELGKPAPVITGWNVEYICKPDGKPLKVTRLLPPKP